MPLATMIRVSLPHESSVQLQAPVLCHAARTRKCAIASRQQEPPHSKLNMVSSKACSLMLPGPYPLGCILEPLLGNMHTVHIANRQESITCSAANGSSRPRLSTSFRPTTPAARCRAELISCVLSVGAALLLRTDRAIRGARQAGECYMSICIVLVAPEHACPLVICSVIEVCHQGKPLFGLQQLQCSAFWRVQDPLSFLTAAFQRTLQTSCSCQLQLQ